MFPLVQLDNRELQLCHKTISSNTFYMIVGHHLSIMEPMSVVRMADGERALMNQAATQEDRDIVQQPRGESDEWKIRYGIEGITAGELMMRIGVAARECTYFAPSISGLTMANYNVYDMFTTREYYVDNFFPNAWDATMKINLYRKAEHVLFIHRNRGMADALQIRCKYALGVKVTYLELSSWQQSEGVIYKSKSIDAPLVIFSGGPANKYIGPEIAKQGKVVLDIGNAAEYWLLSHLKDLPQVRGRYVQLIN